MPRARGLLLVFLALCAAGANAQDRISLDGDIDLRWVHASGETSALNGGLGDLRFDPDHEGAQLGRAFLATNVRISDIVSMHAVFDAYGDGGRDPVDVSEFYLEVRPFPTNSIRWQARIGAFEMPVSLENRGLGWTAVYSITPSALNSWLGEEFRTIGAEVEVRWLGASSGYLGDIALIGAVYAWNDPAGVWIAENGFSLSDRPSTLFADLGRPPVSFYHEIDHKPGYYAGITWRHHDRLELRALRYDNRGDPDAVSGSGAQAWKTRFTSVGARLEPSSHWTFIAQYLDGDTAVGANYIPNNQFYMPFHTEFALASFEWANERLTVRYDDFHTHQVNGFFGPPSDDSGHSWTFAAAHEFGDHWQLVAEWLRVVSRFPPRLELDLSPSQVASQFQLAVRYRFKLGW